MLRQAVPCCASTVSLPQQEGHPATHACEAAAANFRGQVVGAPPVAAPMPITLPGPSLQLPQVTQVPHASTGVGGVVHGANVPLEQVGAEGTVTGTWIACRWPGNHTAGTSDPQPLYPPWGTQLRTNTPDRCTAVAQLALPPGYGVAKQPRARIHAET